MPRIVVLFWTILCACATAAPAAAEPDLSEWQVTKCRAYEAAWRELLRDDLPGLSKRFIAENEGFLERGCMEPLSVCPLSKSELEAANLLTIASMNAGAASSFLPFWCGD